MFRTRYAFALAIAMVLSLLPVAAAAQPDAGQFVILNAQYGHARNHVDVTRQLRDLARQDRPIRVSNNVFGIDPDPGVRKVLRIYARDVRGGPERMFEFAEGSVVDGAMFTGWRGGNWGGGGWSGNWDVAPPPPPPPPDRAPYLILNAQYGRDRYHVDVTGRLRDLVRSHQPFRVGNDAFGIDPAPGVKKVLRIYARNPNGQEQMFEYREGSVIDGSQFRGWGRGELEIGPGWGGRW